MTSRRSRWRPTASLAVCAVPLLVAGCGAESGGLSALQAPPKVEAATQQTYIGLGKRYLAEREPELALRAFQRSIAVEGLSAEAMIGAGIAARHQGLLHEARRYMEQAVLLEPDSAVAQLNLGVVLFQLKEYHGARNAFRSAFAVSSGASDAAVRNLNKTEEIIAELEKNPEFDPSISHDVVRLGGGEFRLVDAAREEPDVIGE